ncbi:MAG: glycosyltransferase [Phycisphaerales bacterium]|nr:glycosyltransferase [Phycisphaerales bacterium]MDB5357197.1 glycosyltransferase [Phycisphaerales bacterium]
MSLRLAYMTGEYPRATDTFIQREVAALRAAGVHVQTLSVRRPSDKENVGPETQAERTGTKYLLPACPWDLFKTHVKLLATSPRRYLSALRTALFVRPAGLKPFLWQLAYFAEAGLVARTMREHQLSHLHNHFSNSSCSVAMLASEMGGFTFSFTMHGPAEFFEPKYWRVDEKIRRALFVCCISHFCRSQAMVFAPQEKWPKLHVVHCGVDPSQFTPARHEGDGRRLLFVGRLAAVKGLPILLEAVALIKGEAPLLLLTVAGDGPDRAKLEQQARELGLAENVRFVGYQSQAQVRQLLGATDVFVMSSFAEGVPVVLMEAMAAGVPVVATRIAGVPELVEEGASGFLVPPGDARSLAERVRTLLDDPALRQRFGAAGRAQVEAEFNLATESQRLVQILTSALEGRTAPIRPAVESRETSAPSPQLQAALT